MAVADCLMEKVSSLKEQMKTVKDQVLKLADELESISQKLIKYGSELNEGLQKVSEKIEQITDDLSDLNISDIEDGILDPQQRRGNQETSDKLLRSDEIKQETEITAKGGCAAGGREVDDKSREESKNDERGEKINPNCAIRMGLLNVRSIKKQPDKREQLRELIKENDLKVFFSTETWLESDTEEEALRQASPENYKVVHQPREKGRGGGAGIQVSPIFEVEKLDFSFFTNFECVAAILKNKENWDEEVLFINLYRTGNSSKVLFQEQFKSLLDEVSQHHSVVITGGFNIWVDVADEEIKNKSKQRHAEEFLQLLKESEFQQHVNEATYESGHTLDLVISRNVEISDLSLHPCDFSDRKLIVFKARPESQDRK